MSNHKLLCFFNKEGDYLNFNYNSFTDRFEGDILFHENSSDTYKTAGVYMLEQVPSFEYEIPGNLNLNKFQLFNEWGLHFYGAKYFTQSITRIEPVNNDPNFYSKWIYGENFEVKFPVGSIVRFDLPLLEFNNTNITYCVVSSKKGAIMIISAVDNASFENLYYSIYTNPSSYLNWTLSGVNLFGVYNYVDSIYQIKLSNWSEPFFYEKFHIGKKLNIVGSEKNDGIITVTEIDLADQTHFEYRAAVSALPANSDLIIEVLTKTDIPKIYEGPVTVVSGGKIKFDLPNRFPKILKPGVEFKLVGSVQNDVFLMVSDIPIFETITSTTRYELGDQVIYENNIYQCIQAYTHSHANVSTRNINPLNTNYWVNPDYIKVDQGTIDESILNCGVYLTNDRFYYSYPFTFSSAVTLASAAEKFKTDLESFNIDLYFEKNTLRADLKYPSKYAEVNFYHTQLGSTYSIGTILQTNERITKIRENLNYELNYNFSSNFRYNVVFTDIDEFGIKLVINKQVYEEEVSFIYTGLVIDMERTIDRTLRNWLRRNYTTLYVLGIVAELSYIGNFYSPFYNSIVLKTFYPNVPLNLDNILVGSTGDYHIEHSRVLFYGMGSYFNIKINDKDYGVTASFSGQNPDIDATLSSWMNAHAETLLDFKIIVTHINNLLKFDIKEMDRRLQYTINTGKLSIPGIQDYIIIDKMPGSEGMLIASNEIILKDTEEASFETDGFATGMVVTINNTVYPFNNQQFNIQFLDPGVMNLSYEGPFWEVDPAICNSAAFVTLAFSLGFGQTGCPAPPPQPEGEGGPYDPTMYDPTMFSLSYNPNIYTINNYNGVANMVDIIYVQLSNSMYALGDDLQVIDSATGEYLATVQLYGNTQSIEMEFNPVNNFIYCFSKQQINIVDPLLNTIIGNISLTYSNSSAIAFDLEINPVNGDVYVTYENWNRVDIFSSNNFTSVPTSVISGGSTRTGAMVFNSFEGDMYVTTDDNSVLRINSNRTLQTTYGITGITHSIFYEPVNEAIYVYTTSGLWKIDNGVTQSIPSIVSNSFNDIIFNNLTGEINISDASNNFSELNLYTDVATQLSVGNYGYLEINQFDGDVYMSCQNAPNMLVLRPATNEVIQSEPMSALTTRLVFNPDRGSVWAIQPSVNNIVEIQVEIVSSINILSPTFSQFDGQQFGTLDPNYVPRENLWLKTQEYVRRPRENFEGEAQVTYYFRWLSDNVPQFFLYDVSGDQLPITGSYAYIGSKPLSNPVLNREPNKDFTKVSIGEYQQTIFDKIEFPLSYIDDEDDVTTEVTPFQLFLGFRSQDEGALRSILQLYKKEDVEVGITASSTTYISFETIDIENTTGDKRGLITLTSDGETFTDKGLKPGQWILLTVKDITNQKNQYISDNSGIYLKIREVYTKYLVVDFFNVSDDFLTTESTRINNYPKTGTTTYLKTTVKVVDKEIGRFFTYGQTEIEDIRFKTELSNIGKIVAPNEVFIFKEYDIFEGATDWTYLNKKRKEMLMMKNLIFPYIGAYKSIINAINYFGYNDLQLNEYYRDIDTNSSNFGKLFKVEIPDIFDNTVEGWNETDFVKGIPQDTYEVTNSFNLTYFITDKDGNNILTYSLDEIIIKLQGLKYWLKRNIIPITHKILDITGRSYVRGGNYIKHRVQEIRNINMKDNMTPITFRLNETYLMPVNSGSTVYNCVIDFYSIIPVQGTNSNLFPLTPNFNGNLSVIGDNSSNFPVYNSPYSSNPPPKPYNGVSLEYPEYYNLTIRTYKTYPEWNPFETYEVGDRVTYLGNFYQSGTSSNRLKNPTRYDYVAAFDPTLRYSVAQLVSYSNEIYVFTGLGATFSATQSAAIPLIDATNWLKITEWKKFNLQPVQTIKEYRRGTDFTPFNFTIDSNIDPFLVVELTTDNGYGCSFTYKRNYEIRGLKDITQNLKPIDPIGPFQRIEPVY
jgi:hypothetical protein